MSEKLNGKTVAILATDGFEESELSEPKAALEREGATVHVIAPDKDSIRAWAKTDWGPSYDVDRRLEQANADDYDALELPGGLFNPDALRQNEQALAFTRHFFEAHKPVGAICHGPWVLINAGVAKGRRMTSYPSVEQDLRNAGAEWVDQEVVVDSGLVTSRKPDDLAAFCCKLVEEIAEGKHSRQHA
ncbi:type 1 glutamine amidotransferase [Halomonas sp. MCCC 1A17488]|uniref:type 1 glutamine amidotransferase domain-containing protein n=1 Tax=unclassified Halomonas TaxID=2609666 RepID=UPI0018D25204|nr:MULTISPECIES: type 1 glutamine amidotransferase domain-containing protein [unclassified Halomonas]MCE8018353.1 type 1 glutamine amidotransferase [Halomonas sp. MCCC 1A17488]MCG3241686.1 type 1 glutamine amidotransferase [Halomonas sp. MCCC 1A17488]QPP49283.1 type 1 glutamine amidotransferase [Halomonas sp. SS10-MC5]